jgi:phospholipase/carboxylesterase
MHTLQVMRAGKQEGAEKVLILLHGRGGSAGDIMSLADELPVKNFELLAPQAANHAWYPYSFLAPIQQNEPWLSSALGVLKRLVSDTQSLGIAPQDIYFTGFSQGACLMLEFLARNAERYGGALAFTGGLIGDQLYPQHYSGDFRDTPIFIGTGNPDPHVPVRRVNETSALLTKMHANVLEKVYPGMGHTITADELQSASRHVFNVS